ncbi:MAG TPA: glycosyl hydrolase family 28 protein [Prolixibacteraceae bacterium]|nr:glycosyl hydrolase family 28 protein [Prolixibacteraceae bacterium]
MMFKFKLVIVTVLLILTVQHSNAQSFDVLKYGAVGDGKTLNTEAVQKAVDACNQNGGGKVVVPSGVFLIGTVILKSNVHLYLETGAVLKGSPNLNDYKPYNEVHYGVLYAENAENITISGYGNIDGNGDTFFDLSKAKKIEWGGTQYTRQKDNYRKVLDGGIGDGPIVPKNRPYQMFIFSSCKNVTIEDILVTTPPFWTMLFADCDGVKVDGIRLWTNMLAPNADGIDVASSNNVTISNCDIRSGDDAIAIVGYDSHFEIPGFKKLRHPSGNILVTGCNLQSYSSGIRIGFLDQNTVRNINISNCNITNSTRGIGIFLRDEGSLENINVSNVNIETKLRTGDWWGNGEPIHISAIRGKDNVKLGKIKNVKFDNVTCRGENGILIYGTEESVIENVTFDNLTFELVDSKLNDVAGGNIDLRGCLGEKNQLFQHDIPGIYAQYVDGLMFENFRLKWTGTRMPYFTNGIEVRNFNDLYIRNFNGTASPVNSKAYPLSVSNGKGINTDLDSKLILKNNVE